MRILALDPGVTTGFAVATGVISHHKPPGASFSIIGDTAITTWQRKDDVNGIWDTLNYWGPSSVVYEKFTPPAATRHRVELFPVQVIGVARLFCQMVGIPEYSHTASQAKRFWTDTKIKRLGLWVPSQGHGMDALRHLLYHMAITLGDKSWIERSKG